LNQIKAPLLIGQGVNDPRVVKAESDQMVEALRDNGKQVEYLVYPDEGHGFLRPENRTKWFAAVESFLAEQLGGRKEPAGEGEDWKVLRK
jgi:dipeptidyl aminopeptidase/acylaminoacyl peptidase